MYFHCTKGQTRQRPGPHPKQFPVVLPFPWQGQDLAGGRLLGCNQWLCYCLNLHVESKRSLFQLLIMLLICQRIGSEATPPQAVRGKIPFPCTPTSPALLLCLSLLTMGASRDEGGQHLACYVCRVLQRIGFELVTFFSKAQTSAT